MADFVGATQDEHGREIFLFQEQETKARQTGLQAKRLNIVAATIIGDTALSSLGPRGMDKMIMSPDGEVVITNDGRTILDKVQVDHPVAKLMVEVSKSQDDEAGDGTTGVVCLASALLKEALPLLERGMPNGKIMEGYEVALKICNEKLNEISSKIEFSSEDYEALYRTAKTTLNSKIIHGLDHMAKIAVDAVVAVADIDRRDVNFDMIKIEGKTGGEMKDTSLIKGIVLDKEWSHPQMVKEVHDAKLCVLTCPFEPPKPKGSHKLNITSKEDYEKLVATEKAYFTDMVKRVKDSGANAVICQWGFDDEANHLLFQNELPAVRWVGGVEIELISIATGARIVPRFEELNEKCLGKAGVIREVALGTSKDRMLIIEDCENSKTVTVFVRGGNQMLLEEIKRSLHDAMCVTRNLIRDPMVVYGGGSAEIACSLAVHAEADKHHGIEQYAIRAFADALEHIPVALSENSGLSSVDTVANIKAKQIAENNPYLGVDCLETGTNDMREQDVFETCYGKKQQFQLATQVARMILKIDDVISPAENV
eukprot:TRINITY_DN5979_c0_g2_i1.p1 TRINITY_DN5979_c0_g2~~TRINITY_DN5979_c0_g2_i1.p1  ORF type:complete len:540 (+),score=212.58 TRINITY_DN5979_c0_g2_i1:43-1662(+)